jgi:hypothetical protein
MLPHQIIFILLLLLLVKNQQITRDQLVVAREETFVVCVIDCWVLLVVAVLLVVFTGERFDFLHSVFSPPTQFVQSCVEDMASNEQIPLPVYVVAFRIMALNKTCGSRSHGTLCRSFNTILRGIPSLPEQSSST